MPSKPRFLALVAVTATLVAPVALPAQAARKAPRYVDLDTVAKPPVTGAEIVAGLEDFVERFPLRQNTVGRDNVAAAEFLAGEAKESGFKVRILELEAGTPTRTVRVVEAIKRGTTKPDNWLAFVAHYDTVAPDGAGATVQGAYDDGSGTNFLRYFGKAFSKIKTKHSIALLWFDAEENGLLASRAYAEMVAEKGQKIDAVLGFDMTGIGYPAPYCICVYYGTLDDGAKAVPILEHVNYDYMKLPPSDGGSGRETTWPFGVEGGLCICGPNIRNSDERSFAAEGYFSMRWTGMREASDYPGYHQPWDTVALMEQVAGSRANLEAGTENTFLSAYYSAMVLDNL
ncbi:MAG TPA: M28 family peptidase [Actinomycetota bacterium]|jgi:hypothetical protein